MSQPPKNVHTLLQAPGPYLVSNHPSANYQDFSTTHHTERHNVLHTPCTQRLGLTFQCEVWVLGLVGQEFPSVA